MVWVHISDRLEEDFLGQKYHPKTSLTKPSWHLGSIGEEKCLQNVFKSPQNVSFLLTKILSSLGVASVFGRNSQCTHRGLIFVSLTFTERLRS